MGEEGAVAMNWAWAWASQVVCSGRSDTWSTSHVKPKDNKRNNSTFRGMMCDAVPRWHVELR